MTVTLPYEFDTSRVVEGVLTGAVAVLAVVVVPGILYSRFVSHSTAAAIQLLLIGALVIYFGMLVFRKLPGSRDAGMVIGHQLATLLGLPYEDEAVPH